MSTENQELYAKYPDIPFECIRLLHYARNLCSKHSKNHYMTTYDNKYVTAEFIYRNIDELFPNTPEENEEVVHKESFNNNLDVTYDIANEEIANLSVAVDCSVVLDCTQHFQCLNGILQIPNDVDPDDQSLIYVIQNPWNREVLNLVHSFAITKVVNYRNFFTGSIPKKTDFFEFGPSFRFRSPAKSESSKGGFGVVVKVSEVNSSDEEISGLDYVVKTVKDSSFLEFYYTRTAKRRIVKSLNRHEIGINLVDSICPCLAFKSDEDKNLSLMLLPRYRVGLIDFINYASMSKLPSRRPNPLTPKDFEMLALYSACAFLYFIQVLHLKAKILHGDIKVDNIRLNRHFPIIDKWKFLAKDDTSDEENTAPETPDFHGKENVEKSLFLSNSKKQRLNLSEAEDIKLNVTLFAKNHIETLGKREPCENILTNGIDPFVIIDFGRAIDIAMLPKRVAFQNPINKPPIKRNLCPQMILGRPWLYQHDLVNVAGVIYSLLTQKAMTLQPPKKNSSLWTPKSFNLQSRICPSAHIWKDFFDHLLNLESYSSNDYPQVMLLRDSIYEHLTQRIDEYNIASRKANEIIDFLAKHYD